MSGAWTINAGGRIYGPFSSDRMRAFVAEGRLAANSLVAREGDTDWHEAGTEPEFVDLFGPRSEPALAMQPAALASLVQAVAAPTTSSASAQPDMRDGQRAHFAVVVDMKSRGTANLEQAIATFGPSYQLLPNIWIVSTDQTVTAVRNRLIQELGKADSLFVIDASRGKASWFNFGPDADVRIRKVWQKAS